MSKILRKIIEIDEQLCDGCGQCVPSCAEGAIQIIDGKAKLIQDKFCDGLGACLGECPQGALKVIEREAEDFDEEAVEEHLKAAAAPPKQEASLACGCPSTQVQSLKPSAGRGTPPPSPRASEKAGASALSNWPIQIRLVPPSAPYLKDANLLVLADCAGVAYTGLHTELLPGRTVLMGCPKLDNAEAYIQKFSDIFQNAGVSSITVVMMEVPCCSGLAHIVKEALQRAGAKIPYQEVVIGVRGNKLTPEGASETPCSCAHGG